METDEFYYTDFGMLLSVNKITRYNIFVKYYRDYSVTMLCVLSG